MKKTLKAIEAKEEQLLETVERPIHWAQRHWLSISLLIFVVLGSVGLWRYHTYTVQAQVDAGWRQLEDVKKENSGKPMQLAEELGKLLEGDLAPSVKPWIELEHGLACLDAGLDEEAAAGLRALAGRTDLAGNPAVEMASQRVAVLDADAAWKVENDVKSPPVEVKGDNPTVKFVTSKGDVVVELFEDFAPNTTANLIHLIDEGWYEGSIIHRVEPVDSGGVVQFGRRFNLVEGTSSPEEGPGYTIKAEIHDQLHHEAGTLAMAREQAYDSAGSQLFFNTSDNRRSYDGRYTVFGKVVEGLPNLQSLLENTDLILRAEVLTRRPHEYVVEKLPRN